MSKPAYLVEADGVNITKQIADRLLSLTVVDEAEQLSDRVEIVLDDRDKLLEIPKSGTWLKVYLGYAEGGKLPVYMGTYAVDDLTLSNGPRSMVVRATALETAPAMKDSRTQSWHDTTLGEIARTIASRSGLELRIVGDVGSIPIKHEDQTAESDIAFLTRLARRLKITAKPIDKALWITRRASDIPATPGVELAQRIVKGDEVSDWRATIKNRGAYSRVKARYFDQDEKKEKLLTVGPEDGNLQTFEEKQLYKTRDEAQRAADSRLQSLQSGEVTIDFSMEGDPEFTAEGQVTLQDFRALVDGTWYIRNVTHKFDGNGYRTTVTCGTKGEANNDWSAGRGENDKRSASEKGSLLCKTAQQLRGFSTQGGPDGGRNTCAWAVNRVFQKAGLTTPWGGSNYVPDAEAALRRSGAQQVSGPEPGAIAIFTDGGNPPQAHIGIVTCDGGRVISNSSSRPTRTRLASPSEYQGFYSGPIRYYRLK
ncbi:phage late control gene D protein GPD [Synechococcus elongatus PCC 6301]|uniref:Phage late control gene D protein GPD n=1 Tax=Synechococcus sp. (strain ATCC 27144 / PCC 6301 / SAUG 1402/1) TaxID=269084 RepID=A0A0H3K4B3_SYNP6|nr:contractile injection system protein, VgrG/Pvc8 family [Synechococcus elongatus]BAD78969.1 phage late control gene D protein GPD [Synechococcus elongatus PCC 6301]